MQEIPRADQGQEGCRQPVHRCKAGGSAERGITTTAARGWSGLGGRGGGDHCGRWRENDNADGADGVERDALCGKRRCQVRRDTALEGGLFSRRRLYRSRHLDHCGEQSPPGRLLDHVRNLHLVHCHVRCIRDASNVVCLRGGVELCEGCLELGNKLHLHELCRAVAFAPLAHRLVACLTAHPDQHLARSAVSVDRAPSARPRRVRKHGALQQRGVNLVHHGLGALGKVVAPKARKPLRRVVGSIIASHRRRAACWRRHAVKARNAEVVLQVVPRSAFPRAGRGRCARGRVVPALAMLRKLAPLPIQEHLIVSAHHPARTSHDHALRAVGARAAHAVRAFGSGSAARACRLLVLADCADSAGRADSVAVVRARRRRVLCVGAGRAVLARGVCRHAVAQGDVLRRRAAVHRDVALVVRNLRARLALSVALVMARARLNDRSPRNGVAVVRPCHARSRARGADAVRCGGGWRGLVVGAVGASRERLARRVRQRCAKLLVLRGRAGEVRAVLASLRRPDPPSICRVRHRGGRRTLDIDRQPPRNMGTRVRSGIALSAASRHTYVNRLFCCPHAVWHPIGSVGARGEG
mmetsp:Transcript_27136/g.55293  ORF Transcript_27136/g.55293 Transcript_27136/m.55293 type:complete len:584 (+) Transcript_27136:276-2027(+)